MEATGSNVSTYPVSSRVEGIETVVLIISAVGTLAQVGQVLYEIACNRRKDVTRDSHLEVSLRFEFLYDNAQAEGTRQGLSRLEPSDRRDISELPTQSLEAFSSSLEKYIVEGEGEAEE